MANLSRSAASSTRNKQRPLLWVAMIFMTSAWAFARSRSRHELCLHDRAMSCVRAALAHGARVPCCVLLRHCKGASTCVLLLFMSRGRAVPLHKRRAFSVPRLYSSGAPLHCRAFTSAARLYSAAFTAAARLYSSTPLQQQCAFAVPCVYSSCRLYSGARLQQRHAFTVPRVNSIGAPLQCRAFTVAARLCSATRLQLRWLSRSVGQPRICRPEIVLICAAMRGGRSLCADSCAAPPNHGSTLEGTARKAAPSAKQPRPS